MPALALACGLKNLDLPDEAQLRSWHARLGLPEPSDLRSRERRRLAECVAVLGYLDDHQEEHAHLREELRTFVLKETYGVTGRLPMEGVVFRHANRVAEAIKGALKRCESEAVRDHFEDALDYGERPRYQRPWRHVS